jgi:citrate lyase subunit beta/citryl-CoA lyase
VDQISVINAVFTPSDQEAAWARRVLDAFEEGARQNSYTVYLDGRLVDGPVADKARTILARRRAASEEKS